MGKEIIVYQILFYFFEILFYYLHVSSEMVNKLI